MPKRKSRAKRSNFPHKEKGDEDDFPDDPVNQDDEDFYLDEIDKFHENKDKIMLDEDEELQSDMDDDEEEVLGLDVDVSDSDEDLDALSDDQDDTKEKRSDGTWGKKRSTFYGADTLEGLEGSDREEAEKEEEEEVLAIQQRLAKQIDEEDIGLDILQDIGKPGIAENQESLKSHITADFSKLSTKAQWRIVRKESPELEDLIKDFQAKLSELESEISPLLKLVKSGKIPAGRGADYVKLKYRVYLAYLLNISFYLALKAKKTSIHNHPVISRLVQYRTAINQLVPLDKRLRPQIEELLGNDQSSNSDNEEENEDRSSLESTVVSDDEGMESDTNTQSKKKRKIEAEERDMANEEAALNYYKSLSEKLQESVAKAAQEQENKPDDHTGGNDRRAINEEISKNKGLTQKRKKIDRNPRVKLRQKYKKAKIRRRGQVREYRPEIKKYSGEASGIRAGLKKSVSLQ